MRLTENMHERWGRTDRWKRAEKKEEKRRAKKQVTARVPQGSILGPALVMFPLTTLAYEVGVLLK